MSIPLVGYRNRSHPPTNEAKPRPQVIAVQHKWKPLRWADCCVYYGTMHECMYRWRKATSKLSISTKFHPIANLWHSFPSQLPFVKLDRGLDISYEPLTVVCWMSPFLRGALNWALSGSVSLIISLTSISAVPWRTLASHFTCDYLPYSIHIVLERFEKALLTWISFAGVGGLQVSIGVTVLVRAWSAPALVLWLVWHLSLEWSWWTMASHLHMVIGWFETAWLA
jgi:hypothetical protein